jgi:hypothetical protein
MFHSPVTPYTLSTNSLIYYIQLFWSPRSLVRHDSAARSSGLVIALTARSRSFSCSAIRAAQLSGGSVVAVSSSVSAGHTSSNASAISRENAATSFCNSRAAVLWIGVNRSKCGTSAAVSSEALFRRFAFENQHKKKKNKEQRP